MTQILAVDCVAKSFRGRRVLSSASLRAFEGQVRVLLGRNGAGKSTLLKIGAGCLAPDSGSVRFAGEAYLAARLSRLARDGLFYLPDHDLFSSALTIRRQLEMLHAQFGGDNPTSAAERMGIAAHLDRRPYRLSGGELRRAELAAAFVRRPRCLLADEPYRGVAPKDAEALSAAFRALAEQGAAVVVTGHEVPTLMDAAHHVTWCTNGTTYELGTPAHAATHESFRREYLVSGARL
jgi:ABC-type multidrug transport system ATPase subunit